MFKKNSYKYILFIFIVKKYNHVYACLLYAIVNIEIKLKIV